MIMNSPQRALEKLILIWQFYRIFSVCYALGTECLGGSSIRGFQDLDQVKDDQISCCHDNHCHGYSLDVMAELLVKSNIVPAGKHVRSSRSQRSSPNTLRKSQSPPSQQSSALESTSISCCPSNVSVLFPVSGISATLMQRVPVLQVPGKLRQPVVYRQCAETSCKILRGTCSQVYIPHQLYTVSLTTTKQNMTMPKIILDNVFVESGCECTTDIERNTLGYTRKILVDPTLSDVFQYLTKVPVSHQDLFNLINEGSSLVDPKSPAIPATSPSTPAPTPAATNATLKRSTDAKMPLLPLPGYPIRIPEGFFNPVLMLVQKSPI